MSSNEIDTYKKMVFIGNNEALTTSTVIADMFNKRHDNVIAKIDKMITEMPVDFSILNFKESFKINELANGKKDRYYQLTKDGFMFVAMTMTGKEAAKWKVKFIQAFNWLAENNKLHQSRVDDFSLRDKNSKSNGSFHGKGLQRRKKEKQDLLIEEKQIMSDHQPSLLELM